MTSTLSSAEDLKAILREDFAAFAEKCIRELNPGTQYSNPWYIEHIAYELRELAQGNKRRMLMALPPRAGKSTIVSVAFAAWCLGHNPATRIVCISYAQDLAGRFSNDFRKIVESDWFQELFPKFKIDPSKCTEREIRTTANGWRFATSVGGVITGVGGHILILDDIIKADEATNETYRNSVMEWMKNSVFSRLDDQSTGKIIVIGQRLHPLDPIGQLSENGDWNFVRLPVIAEKTATYRLSRVNGYVEHVWKVGEILDPARWNEETLDECKTNMGVAAFNAQYLQRPEFQGDAYVDWNWFPRFENPPLFDLMVLSVDPAFATKSTSDWSVIMTIGVIGKEFHIVHVDRKRLGFESLKERVLQIAKQYRADLIFVEEATIGISLIDALKSEGTFKIAHTRPKESKTERMIKVLPLIETGKVWLPKEAPWLDHFRQELQAFPNGQFDDQVDALSQFLLYHTKICTLAFSERKHLGHRQPQGDYSSLEFKFYAV